MSRRQSPCPLPDTVCPISPVAAEGEFMGELLPTRQAAMLQAALLDYLTTTFALADSDSRTALTSFLEHQADGIFKGPYVALGSRLRPLRTRPPKHSM